MFCDRCRAQVQPSQRFCGSCGKSVGVSAAIADTENRVSRNLNLLGALWLVASVFHLLGGLTLFIVASTLFGRLVQIQDVWPVQNFLEGLLTVAGLYVVVTALVGFAAGWGLLERQPWARTLALVLGFPALLHVPFGTALGIYTIYVLLSSNAETEYRQLSCAAQMAKPGKTRPFPQGDYPLADWPSRHWTLVVGPCDSGLASLCAGSCGQETFSMRRSMAGKASRAGSILRPGGIGDTT